MDIYKVIIFDERDQKNKLYLSSDKNEKEEITCSCDLEKVEDGLNLRGLYYGSSTCIRSDGLGWIGNIRYPTSFEELREMKDFPKIGSKKKMRMIISVIPQMSLCKTNNGENREIEEINFIYPKDFYTPYLEIKGSKFLKGIYFRELSRFSEYSEDGKLETPVEISGVKLNDINL